MKNFTVFLLIILAVVFLFTGCAGGPQNPNPPEPGPQTGEISEPRNVELYFSTEFIGIKWDAPTANATQIEEYELSVKAPGSQMRVTNSIPATATYYQLSGFSSETVYEVVIKPIPFDKEKYTSKSASRTSNEKKDVFILFEGTVVDGNNNSISVSDVTLNANNQSIYSGINGEFSLWVPREAKSIFLNHTDYAKTSIDEAQLLTLYAQNGLYMPIKNLILLIQPLMVEKEVVAEEGITATDESGEVKVIVEPDSFDEDVNLTLSTPEDGEISDSDEQSTGIKNISLNIVDEDGNEVAFKKNVSINIDFNDSDSAIPTRLLPSFAPRVNISEAIRGITEVADLNFLIMQRKKNGDIVNAAGEFDKDTMNATIHA